MRLNPCGVRRERRARFESFEERLALSAQPVSDLLIENQLAEAPQPTYGEVASAVADIHSSSGVAAAHDSFGFTGQGQTVAVIDSGIAYDHLALGGGFGEGYRVVGGWDFTEENDADPYDDGPAGFHGTHVAGIVASQDETYTGVAPDVDLVGLRVFNDDGVSKIEWVEDALEWVHENRDSFENPITTVNLSLGTNWNADTVPDWAAFEDELALLEADGIFISVAAGNAFESFGEPGLSYPAASEHVVPVASYDAEGNLSDFSQRNDRVIVAPGENITSSVPGYLFGMPGPSNYYMSASGTSMAAPYVAGASVLMRQAMEFAGYENISQDVIYQHFRDTADLVFDNETGAYYHRLDLERALDSLLPDEFGSNEASAFELGTVEDAATVSGLIGRLDDEDYFTFTAGASGTASISIDGTHDLIASWTLPGEQSNVLGDQLSFEVTEGESYTIGLGTAGGLGYYDLNFDVEGAIADPPPPQDPLPQDPPPVSLIAWGQIDFASFANESISSSAEYRMVADRTGILTVEAKFDGTQGDLTFDVYDSRGTLLGSSLADESGQRLDLNVDAGSELELRVRGSNDDVTFRVTNLVSILDGRVEISGTSQDDTFEFSTGASHSVNVNGVSYLFDRTEISEIQFDGKGGTDSVQIVGTNESESAIIEVGRASFLSSDFTVSATNSEFIGVTGGGGSDQVTMYDSLDDDVLLAGPDSAVLRGEGFENTATHFDNVQIHASAGNDRAELYDSNGCDRFYGRPDSAVMQGSGFRNEAFGFDTVTGYATSGLDRAWLYDSAGADQLEAYPHRVTLSGDGFDNTAQGFDRVYAYATSGGRDEAVMFDSDGNDRFYARSNYALMRGSNYSNYARGFESVTAHAAAGGTSDSAFLFGTSGVELVTVAGSATRIQGTGFSNGAIGFESVRTYGRGGADEAVFYEIGANDSLYGRRNYASYLSRGRESRVYDFSIVSAHAASGEIADADVRAVAYLFEQYGQWKS